MLLALIILSGCTSEFPTNNDISPYDTSDKNNFSAELPCIDENNDKICDSEQTLEKKLVKSETIFNCPQELLKKNYSFAGEFGSAYYPLAGFSRENGDAVHCPKGSKVGQNTNYYYCDAFVFDTPLLTDEAGNVLDETKKIFVEVVVKAVPSKYVSDGGAGVSGSPVELVDIKCYESEYNYTILKPAVQTQGGAVANTNANSCGSGQCLSNGVCCPSYSKYYCEGRCYASDDDAMSASKGECVNFNIAC